MPPGAQRGVEPFLAISGEPALIAPQAVLGDHGKQSWPAYVRLPRARLGLDAEIDRVAANSVRVDRAPDREEEAFRARPEARAAAPRRAGGSERSLSHCRGSEA